MKYSAINIKAEGIITQGDYLSSQYLYIKPRPILAIIGLSLLILAIVALFDSFSWGVLGSLVYFALYFFAYIPWRAIKTYREYTVIKDKTSLEIIEDGIELMNSRGKGIILWGDIVKIKYNKKLLLLYPTQSIFYLVPEHYFENLKQFEKFIKLIESKIKKT